MKKISIDYKFTIDIVEKDEPKEINIELTKGYDVEFTSNSTTDQNVEVKDSLDNLIETSINTDVLIKDVMAL